MVRSGKRLAAAWLGVGLVWIGVAQASWGDEQPQKSQPAATQAKEEKPEPNVAKGRVTNSAGEPIAGATINLKNTLFYGSSAQVKTGKDGTYRVELARGVWHVTAQVDKVFNKKKLRIDLCPEVDEDFANTDGGVRNFTWKLTGEKEDGLGTYGKPVIVYQEPGDYSFQLNDVELTLTPDGPLVDGSKGQPITGKPESTGDGLAVKDVPLGRYKITARLVEEGKPAQPLKVRVRNKGSFVRGGDGRLRVAVPEPADPADRGGAEEAVVIEGRTESGVGHAGSLALPNTLEDRRRERPLRPGDDSTVIGKRGVPCNFERS